MEGHDKSTDRSGIRQNKVTRGLDGLKKELSLVKQGIDCYLQDFESNVQRFIKDVDDAEYHENWLRKEQILPHKEAEIQELGRKETQMTKRLAKMSIEYANRRKALREEMHDKWAKIAKLEDREAEMERRLADFDRRVEEVTTREQNADREDMRLAKERDQITASNRELCSLYLELMLRRSKLFVRELKLNGDQRHGDRLNLQSPIATNKDLVLGVGTPQLWHNLIMGLRQSALTAARVALGLTKRCSESTTRMRQFNHLHAGRMA